ncbi:MAG TPA: hypothetical protein VFJ06_14775 [Halococcus sp.]|nr:hypothetical protein [Halococcus sp.]
MRENQPEHGTLEAIVRENPRELTARIEAVQQGLASEDLYTRRDAGRAIRVAAKRNPELIEPHFEMVVSLLSDQSGSVQLSGTIGLCELARVAPETVEETIPELLALLESATAPAIQMAVLRALTRVGEHSSVAVADETTADVLLTATPPIRTAIVTVFAEVVVEHPSRFPKTVAAMEDALCDESERVRRCAAAALALVATTDRSVVSSVAGITERVEAMEGRVSAQPWHADETIERAAKTLRALDESERA